LNTICKRTTFQVESLVSGLLPASYLAVRNDDLMLGEHTLGDRKGAPLQTATSVRSTSAGFVVSPYDIVIFAFTPANAGNTGNPTGVHGKFEFRVTPPETYTSAYSSGIITASPVANEKFPSIGGAGVVAWTHNGILYVDGLTPGTTWRVYSLTGVLIYANMAKDTKAETLLPGRGIFIITNGSSTIKIVN